ncbi:hypothetical protein [Ferruginibacter profundus]
MSKGIIKFGLKKIIEAPAVSLWEKLVFDATWMEYRMQAANYNQQSKATLFTAIARENSNAEKLHGAVSTAAIGYIRQLQDVIPGLVNAHGKNMIPFKNFKFNIIQSDMVDSALHKVEIIFISEPLTLIDVYTNRYLIAVGDKLQQLQEGKEVETELITQVEQLSIYSFIKPAV